MVRLEQVRANLRAIRASDRSAVARAMRTRPRPQPRRGLTHETTKAGRAHRRQRRLHPMRERSPTWRQSPEAWRGFAENRVQRAGAGAATRLKSKGEFRRAAPSCHSVLTFTL